MGNGANPEESPAAHAVEAAVAFMIAHAAETLTVESIAAAAEVTPQHLHEQFQTRFGVSPLHHLRNLRFDHIHQDLAVSLEHSIAELARRWGFAHRGRLSTAYIARFDESPAATRDRSLQRRSTESTPSPSSAGTSTEQRGERQPSQDDFPSPLP